MNLDDPLLPRMVPNVDLQDSQDGLVIHLRESAVDFAHGTRLQDILVAAVTDKTKVWIDVSAVHYADHFGFDALLSAVRACPGVVRYRGARRPLRSLFILRHLDGLLAD